VPPEDKQKISELLKKPWNPYIRRHSSLTDKSTILKEHTLRQFAGWSPGSNMHLKYLHYFGNESNDNILEAYGIISKDKQLSDSAGYEGYARRDAKQIPTDTNKGTVKPVKSCYELE
jgi:hypothetical protein